jgi:hypothetical protein
MAVRWKCHITEHILAQSIKNTGIQRDPDEYGAADEPGLFKETREACRHVIRTNCMDHRTSGANIRSGGQEIVTHLRIPKVQYSVHSILPLGHILLYSQQPVTGPYPAVFTRACHWTISCCVHNSLSLDHILLCSQQPVTGPYPAVFTRACRWTISCCVHKSLPLDHILLCSQEPAAGPYPAMFTTACHWTISCCFCMTPTWNTDMLDSVDENFMLKEFTADKQFTIWWIFVNLERDSQYTGNKNISVECLLRGS